MWQIWRGRHFRDSTILRHLGSGDIADTPVDGLQALKGWLQAVHYTPKGPAWTLIYRGSRDGWRASDFHAACDGKGPTVVMVLGVGANDGRNFVAGGYAAASWTSPSSGLAVADPESARSVGRGSFLFSLVDAAGHAPVQLPRKPSSYGNAMFHAATGGPMFGGGELVVGGNSGLPLNAAANSWTRTSREDCAYDATAAAARGCTAFHGAGSLERWCFTVQELKVFALVL